MEYYPFDSRNPLYRSVIGAVAAGTSLRLRLLLHRDARCHEAFLRVRRDDSAEIREFPLTPRENRDAYRFYDTEIMLTEGLYWYAFRYTSDFGEYYVTKTDASSLGIVSDGHGARWQQTVYESGFKTPDWLRGGVIYQIFPDRFFASGKAKKDVPADRFLCSDWRCPPEYRQTDSPRRLGNDYYGGDLAGITEKLPYLSSLGVTCLYLNPIFEAHSNHRYNTADYFRIDPLLGDENDLETLCKKASAFGISVILDGVFSHTGDDSRYFNRQGRYPAEGAYNTPGSPYHSWYKFNHFPDDYASWWGVPSLPETNEDDPSFREFVTGKNGVLRYWMKKGVRGWRLDVADELPDDFIDGVRSCIKAENPDAFLLGEVWEDASNKISYGARRRFLRGRQLDSVMNYPLSESIVAFVLGGDAGKLAESVLSLLENYPPCVVSLLMNHIGTHDTARILTRLAGGGKTPGDREWQSHQCLSAAEYAEGLRRLRLAAILQYTLPGVPSLYYGDEAGAQGWGDPFCRGTFPWGQTNDALTAFYRRLGEMRHACSAFREGDFRLISAAGGLFAFERTGGGNRVLIAVNRGENAVELTLPDTYRQAGLLFGTAAENGRLSVVGCDFTVLSV